MLLKSFYLVEPFPPPQKKINMAQRIFYRSTKTPDDKIRFLLKTVDYHFQKNERLLILVPDVKTAEFIDHLLWSEPKESFIPHFITQTILDECIVITTEKENFNRSKTALNLTSSPIDLSLLNLATVIEIEDLTTPQRAQIFKKKLTQYKKEGLPIVSLQ